MDSIESGIYHRNLDSFHSINQTEAYKSWIHYPHTHLIRHREGNRDESQDGDQSTGKTYSVSQKRVEISNSFKNDLPKPINQCESQLPG